jgi:hypothetical protein
MNERIITDHNGRKHITNEPLLHPPAAPRKPLTQDQIVSIRRRDVIQFARAIEAAHGITEKGGAV